MKSLFNGVLYDIPGHEKERLSDYIENVWRPEMERGLQTDNGKKKIPGNIRALSFSLFLREYYEKNFSQYVVDVTENDLMMC
jgi:hypothetical protein